MGRVGLVAGFAVLLCTAAAAWSQESEEGLRPALGDVPPDAVAGPLTTQTPLPAIEAPIRRTRAASDDRLGIGPPVLRLFSSVEIGAFVSSNGDRASGGTGVDAGLLLAPSLRLQSNWARHEWVASGSIQGEYFFQQDDVAVTAAALQSGFRLDIRRTTTADLDVGYSATSDDGGDLEHTFDSSAAITHDFGGITSRLQVGATRTEGGTTDSTEANIALRGTMNSNAILRPFAALTYAPRFGDNGGTSHGGSLAAGFAFDNAPFLTGEASLVYELRESGGGTIGAVGLESAVAWTPTDFTTVEFASTLALPDTATSVRRQWTAALEVSHAISDHVTLFGGADIDMEDSETGTDVTLASDLGVAWQHNPYFGWSLRYENEFALAGDGIEEHRLIASIILNR